jgi:hypothetical protein
MAKDRWFIPTNTENLKMIIAQGLISNSDGFKKYYSDVLELVQGYIPIFKNKIEQDILTYVVREMNDLTPAIIEIDLKKITGIIKKVEDNKLVNIDLKDIANVDILFIQAPLPLSVIATMIFKSKEDKNSFEEDSKLYSNVILADLKLSSTVAEEKLFKSNTLSGGLVNDFKKIEVDVNEINYKKVYAYGGLLLNLFYFAKNGNNSNTYYQLFLNLDKESEKQDIDVYDYFKAFDINDTDIKKKMDYGLINIAIESKDFKEDVLDFLLSDIWDERSRKRTEELANKLKQFESNMDKTVSEQFEEAKTPLEKILLMLFLREDSEALMDYTLELFSESDYLNFAMMFGLRDKFIKIPKELREFNGLQNFVSLKMAEYAHHSIESDVKFKSPSKPLTIMDMLNKNSIKKRVIRALKVEEAIETIMPNRDYKHKKGKNIYIGFVEPEYKLLENEYFKIISTKKIIKAEYNKFSKMK